MQFLILAQDQTDALALTRRLAAREEHLAVVEEYKARGHMIAGAALLDEESGKMHGSAMLVDFPTREDLEEWLQADPYMVGNVWGKVDILPCKLAPPFAHLVPKKS